MRTVRTTIEIRQGVKVELLFTPRLYSFKGKEGVDFTADKSEAGSVFALYADIIYCAALNLWTLQGNDADEFPHHRADFHEFSMADPKAFGKVVNFALEALTGKGLKDFATEGEKVAETGENAPTEVKKKETFALDYSAIEAFLVGRCGMTELQAGWTSYSEYRMRFEGEEQRERQEWERCRWMAFLMMQMHPYIKAHQKPGTPMAWLPFPWEKESIQAPEGGWGVTEEESNELNRMLKAFIEKNNKVTS